LYKVIKEMGLCTFLTADGRPQTATLEADRRRRIAVGGRIWEIRLTLKKPCPEEGFPCLAATRKV
jgi:hypothetical protein